METYRSYKYEEIPKRRYALKMKKEKDQSKKEKKEESTGDKKSTNLYIYTYTICDIWGEIRRDEREKEEE